LIAKVLDKKYFIFKINSYHNLMKFHREQFRLANEQMDLVYLYLDIMFLVLIEYHLQSHHL
jgi:hypothetical protein